MIGLEISRTTEGIQLGQQNYIKGIIKRFRMGEPHGVDSPMDPDVRLENDICEDKPANKQLYLSITGSLMYAALGTRPNIAFAVTALSRYNESPLATHLTASKRVLRYLKDTVDIKLQLTGYIACVGDTLNKKPRVFCTAILNCPEVRK